MFHDIHAYHIFTLVITIVLLAVVANVITHHFSNRRKRITSCNSLKDLLKDTQRATRHHYTIASGYLLSILKSRVNDTTALSSLHLPPGVSRPLPDLFKAIAVAGYMADSKTGVTLFRLREEIRYQHQQLRSFISRYQQDVQSNEKKYQANIIELSRMHDELGRYMTNKNFDKSNGADWYEGYFSIFGAWFQNGANKDMTVTYNDIVLKIIALNQGCRYVPFVIQTTACSLNCDTAYHNIIAINNLLEEKVKSYLFSYKLAYKTLRLLTQKTAFKLKLETSPAILPAINQQEEKVPAYVQQQDTQMLTEEVTPQQPNRLLYVWSAVMLLLLIIAVYFFYSFITARNTGPESKADTQTPVVTSASSSIDSHVVDKQLMADPDTVTGFNILFDADAKAKPFVYGIDISKYQGRLIEDLDNLDTLHFLICKATEGGSSVDPDFSTNWSYLKNKKIIRGAYHFFHSEDAPLVQATLFEGTIKGLRSTDLPPIVDVEESSLKGKVEAKSFNRSLLAFLQYIEAMTGRKPIIYSDVYFADKYLIADSLSQYPLWLADYSRNALPVIPRLWKDKGYVIWQRTSSYNIGSHKTDFDIFNGNGAAFANFIRSH